MRSFLAAVFCCLGTVAACSSGGSSAVVGSGGDGGVDGKGARSNTPDDQSGAPYTTHTPVGGGGCRDGFKPCGDVCADLQTDNRHCGTCESKCGYVDGGSTWCVEGKCAPATASSCTKLTCDGACVSASSIDHCGSCFNQCADSELCLRDKCIDAAGDGGSCETALLASDDEAFEFRYPPQLRDNHVFRCGNGSPSPTRWFKWKASRDQKVTFEVQGAAPGDDYILEVFDAAGCAEGNQVGCNRGGLPELNVDVKSGITYFIAIGQLNAPSNKLPSFRADD